MDGVEVEDVAGCLWDVVVVVGVLEEGLWNQRMVAAVKMYGWVGKGVFGGSLVLVGVM